jgi:ribokinase
VLSCAVVSTPRILVVGSINVDLVAHVDRLPGRGETVAGGRLERSGGGKGANQAVAAARAGGAVSLVGAVGDDEFGDQALDELRDEGIDVSAVLRLPDVPTGVALIAVDGDGDNQIAVASGANHAIDAAMVEPALERLSDGAGCVLVSFELTDEVVLAAARAARAAGATLVVSPAPARPLPDELCAAHPILVPNEQEALELAAAAEDAAAGRRPAKPAGERDAKAAGRRPAKPAGEPDAEAAGRRLAELTGAAVVITLGARGALAVDGDRAVLLPAPAVRAVDTTGAGDAFTGVLARALAGGDDVRTAAALAVAAATRSVTVAGAR